MSEIDVYSQATESQAIGEVREAFRVHGRCKVKVTTGKRSLNQNDLSHAWYEQIACELREDDALGWKCYCKLHHGVPILRAEDSDFRETYDAVLLPLTYEQKREAMKCWPVTSLMTKPQLSKYLEEVQKDFDKRNVRLEFPLARAA